MAATNVPATAMPTTPDRGNEPFAQGDATRSRSHRWRRGSLMAPTQTKATAEHPASTRKHAANPAAFTSPNATRGPRRSEAEVVRRYRPSQRPRAWGGAASETVAVADDQKEARPTACTQRTKSICQNSAHSGNRTPPEHKRCKAHQHDRLRAPPIRRRAEGEAQESRRGQSTRCSEAPLPPTSLPQPPQKRGSAS